MCGIAGFVDTSRALAEAPQAHEDRLCAMINAIAHRGPDDWGIAFFGIGNSDLIPNDHGTWTPSPDFKLALGHRRLAIIDLSLAGHQPMFHHDRSLCITFNGEIYNYVELREELAQFASFRTGSDTEVLLEAYRRWGTAMLPRLDGMFAFALWDGPARKLLCARDPLGIKPFYYASTPERFLFGSEPKAVLAGLGSTGHVNRATLSEFLVLGVSDHGEGTCYREVRQLRGGHWIEVSSDGTVSNPRAFWRASSEPTENAADVVARVRQQVDLAVHRQLRSDVPVGGCLSGGLDSGSIIASVSRLLGRDAAQFRALTLSNEGFEGDEGAMASLTAKTTGVRWVPVVPDLQSMEQDLEAMIRAMGEPFSTLSMLGQYKLMQQARREGLKVMLDGQGGDEIFLGYPTVAQRVIGDYLRRGHFADALSEWFGLQRNAGLPLVRSLLGNAFFSSPRLGLLRNTERVRGVVERDLIAETRREVVEDLFRADDTTSLQIRELTRYVLPQLLRYEDRNSMAFGLEARVPLLAVDLVNLALRLPLDWKVRKGWTKFALREAMRGRLPDGVLWNRRKRGFEVPQGRWLQTMLPTIRGWLEDLPRDAPVNGAEIAARLSWGEDAPRMSRCLSVALWIRFSGVQA